MKAIEDFNTWYNEELKLTKASIPTACCLSTIGTDGFPNARIVSLKAVMGETFIVTGTLTSRKGTEINKTNKVALTFWWPETARQVRIQGSAAQISDKLADQFFAERNRDSQIVSIVSNQGQKLDSLEELSSKYQEIDFAFANQPLPRPVSWGGYSIAPVRIEFLEFKATRFHDRKLYELINGQWEATPLQP